MTDFFLVHQDPAYVHLVKSALTQVPDSRLVGNCDTAKDALFLISSTPIRVALVAVNLPDMDGIKLVSQIVERYPDVCVVPILLGNEGGEVWQKVLQYNLRNVINGPVDVNGLAGILKQAAERAAELGAEFSSQSGERGKSYMITVASARGGTGKTLFASNFMAAMAGMKANASLIDFSMHAGDFFTMLDYVPRHTMADVIAANDSGIDSAFVTNLMAQHPLGFKFLACPNQDFDFYGMNYNSSVEFLKCCRSTADYILVDTGAYDLPPTAAAIDEADVVFLLTTRDLARLLSLQRYIKSLKARQVLVEKLKVVVNDAEVGTEISENEIESVLEHPVTAYLPSIASLAAFSINSGNPLAQSKPDHPYCMVTRRLAEISLHHWLDVSEG